MGVIEQVQISYFDECRIQCNYEGLVQFRIKKAKTLMIFFGVACAKW